MAVNNTPPKATSSTLVCTSPDPIPSVSQAPGLAPTSVVLSFGAVASSLNGTKKAEVLGEGGCRIDVAGVCTLGCTERAAAESAGRGPPARSALFRRVSGRPASGSAPGHPGSDAAGGEAVRVTCGPGRTPPSALGLLRPFPHAPCPARDSAGQRRHQGASGLEAKRPRHPPQHVPLRPCRSKSVPMVPGGAEMGTGTTLGGLGGWRPRPSRSQYA